MLPPIHFDPARHRKVTDCKWLDSLRLKTGRQDLSLYEHMGPPWPARGNYVLYTPQADTTMNEMCVFPCHPDLMKGRYPCDTRGEEVTDDLVRAALRPGLMIVEGKQARLVSEERDFRRTQEDDERQKTERRREQTAGKVVVPVGRS